MAFARRGRVAGLSVAVAFVWSVAAALAPNPATAALPACDWPAYGHDAGHSFAQDAACTPVSRLTAPTLAPKWVFPTPDSVTASPTVVGDTVYVGSWDGTFYALPTDPEPGPVTPRWTFDVTDENEVAFGRIVSSAAVTDVGDDRVVLFGGGATLYALDAATGDPLAELCLDPRDIAARCQGSDDHIEIESSPAVVEVDGAMWVIVGFDVHNNGGVGRTGVVAAKLLPDPWRLEPVWKFDPEAGVANHGSDLLTAGSGTGDGCGGVWSSPAVDVELGLVFFGTASCSVDGVTSGESLWSVDLRSGEQAWVFHPPRDSTRLDDDFGASPNLLPDSRVGNGGKDGWYYSLDRATGEPAWASHAGQAGHLNEDFAVGGMLGSSAVGSVGGEPAIFVTTAISTPFGQSFAPDDALAEDPGRLYSVHALSAADGGVLWRSPLSRQSYGSASFAGGVVFVPSTFDDRLVAFDADTGLPLWSAPLVGPSSSTPVVVGDSVYIGSGTRTSDVEFKMFGAGAFSPLLGPSPLSPLSGVTAFELTAPA